LARRRLLELTLGALLVIALLFAPAARAATPFVEVAAFVAEPAAQAPARPRAGQAARQQAPCASKVSASLAVAPPAAPRQHAQARRVAAPLYVMHCAFLC
jgi:hypothetical protein